MTTPVPRVPGEDLPVLVPLALALVGGLSTLASAHAFAREPEGQAVASSRAVAEPAPREVLASPTPSPSGAPEPIKAGECPPILVLFESGGAVPSSADAVRIQALAGWLDAHPEASVRIDGHADHVGGEDNNLALSYARARAVAKVLEDRGVPRARVKARGFGAYQPLDGVAEDSPANRRAEVAIKGGRTCPEIEGK